MKLNTENNAADPFAEYPYYRQFLNSQNEHDRIFFENAWNKSSQEMRNCFENQAKFDITHEAEISIHNLTLWYVDDIIHGIRGNYTARNSPVTKFIVERVDNDFSQDPRGNVCLTTHWRDGYVYSYYFSVPANQED